MMILDQLLLVTNDKADKFIIAVMFGYLKVLTLDVRHHITVNRSRRWKYVFQRVTLGIQMTHEWILWFWPMNVGMSAFM